MKRSTISVSVVSILLLVSLLISGCQQNEVSSRDEKKASLQVLNILNKKKVLFTHRSKMMIRKRATTKSQALLQQVLQPLLKMKTTYPPLQNKRLMY